MKLSAFVAQPLLLFVLLLFPISILGFDDQLKGFVLTTGVGVGEDIIIPHIEVDSRKGNGDTRTNTALCLDFKIGKNFGNRFEFAYVNKSDLMYPYTTAILNNANELELSYYLRETAPLIYINEAEGADLWIYPFNSKTNSEYHGFGFCFSLGVGVEFIKHVSALFEYQFSQPGSNSEIQSSGFDTSGNIITTSYKFKQVFNTNALRLTLRYTFY